MQRCEYKLFWTVWSALKRSFLIIIKFLDHGKSNIYVGLYMDRTLLLCHYINAGTDP